MAKEWFKQVLEGLKEAVESIDYEYQSRPKATEENIKKVREHAKGTARRLSLFSSERKYNEGVHDALSWILADPFYLGEFRDMLNEATKD